MNRNRQSFSIVVAAIALLAFAGGCSRQQPVTMAPPVAPPPPVNQAPGSTNVYDWHDVPVGQQVPINRAVFDQGGYQLFAGTGETIIVPFVNQNMYVMKFGRAGSGGMYFVNDGTTPTLYVSNGGFLENASAQNARWYPFPQNYAYQGPVYIGLAPSWADFIGMGWYPGMAYYGGYWGYRPWYPGFVYPAMVGLAFNIGGRPYYGWNSYQTYYRSNPVSRVSLRPTYNYSSVGRRPGSSFGRNSGTGSFGNGNNYSTARNRSFGSSGGSFGRSSGTGSFGGGGSANTTSSVGRSSGTSATSSGSFGGTSSGYTASGRSRGSFGGGTSGYSGSSSGRSGGGSIFGGGSSFGRSGGGSFGGSFGRSGGGSFGRRR